MLENIVNSRRYLLSEEQQSQRAENAIVEDKMAVEESSSVEFEILDKVSLDEFDPEKIKNVEASLSDVELTKVKELECKGLNLWIEFPWFDDAEVIRVILSHVQNDKIVLDKPYPITKEIILVIISLCNYGDVATKKSIKNREVETLIDIKGDH